MEFSGSTTAPKASAHPQNIPLGIMDLTEYEEFDVELETGDCLLSYTDALIESRDADGEMLGEAGVLRIMRLLGDVRTAKVDRDTAERSWRPLSRESVRRRRDGARRARQRAPAALLHQRKVGGLESFLRHRDSRDQPPRRTSAGSRFQPAKYRWRDYSGPGAPLARQQGIVTLLSMRLPRISRCS